MPNNRPGFKDQIDYVFRIYFLADYDDGEEELDKQRKEYWLIKQGLEKLAAGSAKTPIHTVDEPEIRRAMQCFGNGLTAQDYKGILVELNRRDRNYSQPEIEKGQVLKVEKERWRSHR